MSSQGFEDMDGGGLDGTGEAGGPGSRASETSSGARSGQTSGDQVAAYAAEVRAQLADLSDAESAELLEDLEDHLREVAAEGAGSLRERLGAPGAYARELRQAAGLPEPGEGSGSGSAGRGARSRPSVRVRVRQALVDAERRARGHRAGREVLDFLPSLRPAWWVLRGWAAVRLLEVMTTDVDPWHDFALVPQVGNSTVIGFLALAAAVPASVYAARRTVPDGWRRRAVGAGEGILVLFTIGMALSALSTQSNYGENASSVAFDQGGSLPGLVDNGKPISNLYVYDRAGKPLDGVLVYDQDGQPIQADVYAGGSILDNDGWIDGNGSLVANIFPQQMLQTQWDDSAGGAHYVVMPPPEVNIPQGLHRASAPQGAQQSPATPTTAPTTTPPTTPTTTPSTTSSTPGPQASSPTSATPTSGATGAQPTSALPSTPAPSGTKG
ncbi:conserved hypothetical protein [Catenulispora acidiphila DSM 44928]|uniref:Uncharacterized protein n=1 Tax=Catenulispora acidiphila (strain DSM 44928 / JCM 14897 / NBRC 102108 / NRRL B-24433 / ID139908) TaxID=479433 RepID=C7Q623_CATAD|nr:hypothetical protein [Catenulispora acidiphila]ACU70120.1 conserved hypothetical protein [Catenulispora acidiphila DSM 44928]